MAAFSHPYHPFLIDSAFLLDSPSSMNPSALTLTQERHHFLTPSDLSHLDPYSAIQHPQASYVIQNQEPNFLTDSVAGTKVTFSHDSESSITKRHSNNEDSAALDKLQTGDDDPDSQKMTSMDKRRNTRRSSSLVPVKPKVATQGKSKRQKKSDEVMQGKEKQTKAEKKAMDEPPTGYIHVRARRGQATDSHSLAERVRREKISERMRILQRLVPGCDKVTGKALMLDEIINYVQSLQNQVEFLSMRLASLNPTSYDFSMDLDAFKVGQEKLDNTTTCRPDLHLTAFVNATPATTIATPTATSTMANTYPFTSGGNDCGYTLFSNSDQVSVQGQRENVLGQEIAHHLYWDMEEQRQKYLNPRHHETTYAMPTNGVY